jgi:hypothetical protein
MAELEVTGMVTGHGVMVGPRIKRKHARLVGRSDGRKKLLMSLTFGQGQCGLGRRIFDPPLRYAAVLRPYTSRCSLEIVLPYNLLSQS